MKKTWFLLLVFFSTVALAQSTFSGVVKDLKTKQPLPFATITTSLNSGEITDNEGKFTVQLKENIGEITISYLGYKTKKIKVDPSIAYYTILLEPKEEHLKEILLRSTENPALNIIRGAIANKNKNYIQKALRSFQYHSYNKLVVSASPDSINGNIDSLFVIKNGKKVFREIDSSSYKFKKRITKSHLYLSEKISEHQFIRNKNKKETVLASRMAGFQQPLYEFLALDIDNFTFYNEVYSLLGNKYVSPLAKNAIKKYDYKILDTISQKTGSSFMIYFKPKLLAKEVGLEGIIYINSKSYALEKGVAYLKGIVNIKATQQFNYLPEYNIWFPNETEISIRKGKNKTPISLFGVIRFNENEKNDTIVRTNKKSPSDITYLISKTKNFDIKVNIPLKIANSASSIEIDDEISERNEAFWNKYRTDSITNKGMETYRFIDSVAQKEGVERKLNLARKIVKGYYTTKYFDIDLSQLINFNSYEGFRLGFGGITNSNFSKKIRFDGYTAYGFKDKKIKYHLGGALQLNKQNNTWLGVSYTDDLKEAAKIDFLFDDTSFSLINPRNLNIGLFYGYRTYNVNFSHDIFPNVESKIELSNGNYDPKFDYTFFSKNRFYNKYKLSAATFTVKWTPFSKYMNSPIGKLTVKNGYPKVTLQVTKSFDNILKGDFDFTQLNFKFEHIIKLLRNSSTSFLVQGGIVGGHAPISHLYNTTPNYSLKNPWIKRVNFSGTNAFETMTFNEFISERYVSLQARHNFHRFKISKKFKPRLSLISRFAIGTIDNPEIHNGVEFNKMNKGYLESGFVLNHLFKGFGISSFYRYGAYSFDDFSDNLAVKLTYVLGLGF